MFHSGTNSFETERLICRPFFFSDCSDMLENWIADPDIQHEYGEPTYTDAEAVNEILKKIIRNYERADYYRWAVIERASGKNIGQIAFCRVYSDCRTAEIEYCIGKEFQGRGYAGEALAGVIGFAFSQTDFQKLEAFHRRENTKSGRVLEKSAMHLTETIERFKRTGVLPLAHGEVCYCIERE